MKLYGGYEMLIDVVSHGDLDIVHSLLIADVGSSDFD